jgi:DNA-binding NarL/FixJ family response regulator
MHTNPQTARQMLQAGARGYITKSAPIEEVVDAIRAVAEGHYYISRDLVHHFPELEFVEPGDSVPMPASGLSAREREVLQLVVEGKSSKEVGRLLHVTTKTIEHHRHNIMQKLRIESIPELTKYAIREGLTSLET